MAYTNKDNIEKFLGVDITGIDAFITTIIAAVKKFIDNYTGKTFETGNTTKHYDGNGQTILDVDNFNGAPTVKILNEDGTTYATLNEGASADFLTYPLNETEKTQIKLTDFASVATFPLGNRRVEITADFGAASSCPEDITLVATILASRIVEKSLKGGELKSVGLDAYSATFKEVNDEEDPLGVYTILEQHRDITI